MVKKRRICLCFGIAVMILVWLTGAPVVSAAEDPVQQQGIVDKALVTFRNFMADKEMEWLQKNLKDYRGVLIVPSLLKAGFIFGGSGGSGVLLVRDEKTGEWSQPVFYGIGSVTFGLQIGGESAEVIMLIKTQKALDALFTTEFKLGGDASVAMGPVGIGAKSAVMADIVSFSKSKGLFAGLNLEGSVVKPSDSGNNAYYKKAVSPVDIIVKRAASNPGSAALREALEKAVK